MNPTKRARLIQAIKHRPAEHNQALRKLRARCRTDANRPDWLWHLLLSSMATLGNTRGYEGLINNPLNYALVSYKNLRKLSTTQRLAQLNQALTAAKVRRPKTKVIWLQDNLRYIESCGGIETVQQFILGITGREFKLRFITTFSGIGDKYGRNIFMDLYDPDFTQSIAIDERILSISKALKINVRELSYEEHEKLYQDIAAQSGINSWKLDRLLYTYKTHYLGFLK